MTLEADFINDPINFMKTHAVRPIGGSASKIVYLKFSEDPTMSAKKNSFHWYSKKLKFYKLQAVPVTQQAGAIRAYWLGYQDNFVEGTSLGIGVGDPKFMFTVTMNSCSFGHQQTPGNAAYVTHHNARLSNNDSNVIENQAPIFPNGAVPGGALTFHHRGEYMTDGKNNLNMFYRGTTFGVRDTANVWNFYIQNRKYHGAEKDKTVSLKGVINL